MKRIGLFLITNMAIVLVLGIVLHLLGVDRILNEQGTDLNINALLVSSAVIGFGGALISLAMSKWSAKRMTGARVIQSPSSSTEVWLVDTVRRQAQQAGIGMPEVAIYDAPDVNAFATGMSRNNALVAVSSGLLQTMSREEAEAVLGHEISHVANGDMVTMALIQGVLNTFVIFLARVVGRAVDSAISGGNGRDGGGIAYFLIVMALQVVFGLFASIISMWFSRWREFRADAGGARLAGRDKMINALQRLAQTYGESTLPQQIQAFGISGQVGSGIGRLFMSHPPLVERIAALRNAPVDPLTSRVVVR